MHAELCGSGTGSVGAEGRVTGLCGSGTDLCGTGWERDQYLVPRRALHWGNWGGWGWGGETRLKVGFQPLKVGLQVGFGGALITQALATS